MYVFVNMSSNRGFEGICDSVLLSILKRLFSQLFGLITDEYLME